MKNKIFKALNVLLCSLLLLALFGCNLNEKAKTPDPVVEPPKPESKNLTYRYYTLEDDVTDLSFIQGYPWLNTSIVGVMDKIKRPSVKDDFFAYSNYDALRNFNMPSDKNKYGGLIFKSCDLAEQRLNIIVNDTNSSLNVLNKNVTKGDLAGIKSDIEASMNYTQTDIDNLFKSKDVFYGTFSQLELIDKPNGVYVSLSENYQDNLLLTYYVAAYYGIEDDYISGLDSIREAEGINILNFDQLVKNTMQELMNLYFPLFDNPIEHSVTTVGNLNNVFTNFLDAKSALKALGYEDNHKVIYDNATLQFVNSLSDYVKANGYDLIKNMITLSKILYYRYYIGAENYLNLYKDKLSKTNSFVEEDILTTISVQEMALKIMQRRYYSLLSKEYCSRYANNQTREVVANLIKEIVDEYKLLLAENDWLSEETKNNALEKIGAMFYITYYEDGLLEAPNFSSNKDTLLMLDNDYYAYQLSYYDLVNCDIIKTMGPYTSNAIYFSDYNGFMITHGIVSSFIDNNLSKEELYGVIGAVIGHEISHGFDSTGSQYDKNGARNDWWTEEDKNVFNAKVKKIVDLYDSQLFSFSGSKLIGSLVDGEVTADMGGMRVILRLAAKMGNCDYKKLFESYASFFGYVYTHDKGLADTKNNTHPLSYLRVNLTIAQFDEFQKTYNIKEGDGMYIKNEDRITIW